MIDERTRRFWPVFNEEYSLDAYVDHFAAMAGDLASASEYYLHPVSYGIWRRGGGKGPLPAPGRNANLVPATVLGDHDYPRRVNPNGLADVRGTSSLPAKSTPYTFGCGKLSEAEMTERARAFGSPLQQAPWRHIDEQTVKYHWQDPEVDALYRYTQERSRLLHDRGSALRRADIDAIRTDAGERPWSQVSSARELAAR
jgi:hypothetical protein